MLEHQRDQDHLNWLNAVALILAVVLVLSIGLPDPITSMVVNVFGA